MFVEMETKLALEKNYFTKSYPDHQYILSKINSAIFPKITENATDLKVKTMPNSNVAFQLNFKQSDVRMKILIEDPKMTIYIINTGDQEPYIIRVLE